GEDMTDSFELASHGGKDSADAKSRRKHHGKTDHGPGRAPGVRTSAGGAQSARGSDQEGLLEEQNRRALAGRARSSRARRRRERLGRSQRHESRHHHGE